jgi:hypothetical protein
MYLVNDRGENRCSANDGDITLVNTFGLSEMQSALGAVPFFDPANPNTYTFVNLATAGKKASLYIMKSMKHRWRFTNLGNLGVRAIIYLCGPRIDHGKTILSALTDGWADCTGSVTNTGIQATPEINPMFNTYWRVIKKKRKFFRPRSYCSVAHEIRNVVYDASFVQTHTDTFCKSLGCLSVVVKLLGVPAHDAAVTTQYGYAAGGLDWEYFGRYTLKYEAGGGDIYWITAAEGNDSFTGAPTTSVNNTDQLGTFIYPVT